MKLIPGIVAAAVMVGTAHAEPRARTTPVRQTPAEPSCPAALRGVRLVLAPVDRGIAFDLATPAKQHVKPLRALLRQAAELLERHAGDIATERQQVTPDDKPSLPPVRITVTDIGAGARVTVRAQRPHDVKELRRQALLFESFWDDFECVTGSI